MKKILSKLRKIERTTIVRNSFLLPIFSVVLMSISHVISWYDLGNPFSWAIYLSIAVEIFALASVSAATIKMKKGSIWLLFCLVTLIQIVGNVFFTYQDINVNDTKFLSWVELVQPWFEDWTSIDHRRLLAIIQGGTLPFMSLIALHFYIKFNENLKKDDDNSLEVKENELPPIIPSFEPIEPNDTIEPENTDLAPVAEPINIPDSSSEEEPAAAWEALIDEKKTEDDQIHISDNLDNTGKRRRLHPSRY
jgi:hypothetical protein